jgi:hypothetical protein
MLFLEFWFVAPDGGRLGERGSDAEDFSAFRKTIFG